MQKKFEKWKKVQKSKFAPHMYKEWPLNGKVDDPFKTTFSNSLKTEGQFEPTQKIYACDRKTWKKICFRHVYE